MAQRQRVGFQTRRLGVRIPLASFIDSFSLFSFLFFFFALCLHALCFIQVSSILLHVLWIGTPSGVIRKNWNDTEKISMAPAQGWHAQIENVSLFLCLFEEIIKKQKKRRGPAGIWTRIIGFKVQCDNHYTTGPLIILFFFLYSLIYKKKKKRKIWTNI